MKHPKKKENPYKIPSMELRLVVREGSGPDTIIGSPSNVEAAMEWLKFSSEERFFAIHLNGANGIIGVHEVSHGTVTGSLVHPREAFKAAILANSSAVTMI